MSDLLNLPHLRVKAVTDNGDHYVIEAIGGVEPTACPKCGKDVQVGWLACPNCGEKL